MSVMKNQPALVCKRCRRAYTFFLKTAQSDAEGEQLFKFMDGILKDGLCADCKAQESWYIMQGRHEEWKAGNT
jgi:hypothetical protein